MNLQRWRRGERPLVIGHRGAAAIAPANTLAAFEAAIAEGVDLVEFDVLRGLVLGHSGAELPAEPVLLDDALALLARHGVGAHADLKEPGYEQDVVAALARHGVGGIVSTAFASIARRVHGVPVAIGYPRDRLGASTLHWPEPLPRLAAGAVRPAMPLRIPLLLRWARADLLALHHTLCSRAAVATAHRRGAPVLAWTVNDEQGTRRVVAAGVDGIVTDDPKRVLATLARL